MFNSLKLISILQIPRLISQVVQQLNTQKKFLKENIRPIINELLQHNDGSIHETDLKKIYQYYGLAVPAILGEAFCLLHGTKMTGQERMAATCQGAATGLFDDFFDKQKLPDEILLNFIEHPETVSAQNSNQQLFLSLYRLGLKNLPSRTVSIEHIHRVFHVQLETRKQALPGLSEAEIKDITLRKGALSLLLYRTSFAFPIDAEEQAMLYKLGGVMQLSNDIFDVYKDSRDGIHTLVTDATSITGLRKYFVEIYDDAVSAAYRCPYPRKQITEFLQLLSLAIFSRTMVCLDQFEKNEKRSGGVFTPAQYTREALICDMDKAVNKWRSVGYLLRQSL